MEYGVWTGGLALVPTRYVVAAGQVSQALVISNSSSTLIMWQLPSKEANFYVPEL